MRWLDGISDSMDMSLSELRELVNILVAGCELLVAAASIAEHGLQGACSAAVVAHGLSCCGMWDPPGPGICIGRQILYH